MNGKGGGCCSCLICGKQSDSGVCPECLAAYSQVSDPAKLEHRERIYKRMAGTFGIGVEELRSIVMETAEKMVARERQGK